MNRRVIREVDIDPIFAVVYLITIDFPPRQR